MVHGFVKHKVFRSGQSFAGSFRRECFSAASSDTPLSDTIIRTDFRSVVQDFRAETFRYCLTLGRWLPPFIVPSLHPAHLSACTGLGVDMYTAAFGSFTNSIRVCGFQQISCRLHPLFSKKGDSIVFANILQLRCDL